ncbi:glutathione-regulated potassium-efflux system protein [Helicobacter mustelae]|nr:glutathione-regulated potassium-efflux system protein [Helicobacter mustelae]
MSIFFNLILKFFDIPVIIGYIVTGVFIAHFFKFNDFSILSELAEFGIVFLMFMIGLEFSFDRLKSMKEEMVFFGILQLVGISTVFFLLAHFVLGLSSVISLVISMSFSLSSTAIVLKSFDETKQLGTIHGKSVLGILIMQDIAVIPILIILALLSNKDSQVSTMLLKTFTSIFIILILLILPGKYFASKILRLAAKSQNNEIFMASILLILLGAAELSGSFGFSMSLGAFIAGMMIAKSPLKHQVESDLKQFRDIFLALFFITVGMQVDLPFLLYNFFNVVLLVFFVMSVKTSVLYYILRFFRSDKSALKTACALAQVGEFSFAIFVNASGADLFNAPLQNGFLKYLQQNGVLHYSSQDLHQFLVLTVVFSMVATPFILKNLSNITAYFLKRHTHLGLHKDRGVEMVSVPLFNHVVVAGYGAFGEVVVEKLKEKNINYVAMDYDILKVEKGEKRKDRVVFGNITQNTFLEKFHLQDAKCLIIAIDNTSIIHAICNAVLKIAPNIDIIAKVDSQMQEEELRQLNVTSINTHVQIADLLVECAIKERE